MVKSIMFGVSVCFTILALSCGYNNVESNAQNFMNETTTFEEIGTIFLVSVIYGEANGKLPDSIEELMLFCSESEMPCPELNWNNFSWRKIDDGQVEIEHKESNSIITISLGRDIPKDIMKDNVQERLKKELETLLDMKKEGEQE